MWVNLTPTRENRSSGSRQEPTGLRSALELFPGLEARVFAEFFLLWVTSRRYLPVKKKTSVTQ
ncbi:hypothetical protein DPEC_G00182620 [Dallia pectoralis]|uniref:Uncharacterized protein n=1 Tax=Dallia pectoralis TaxID=75939 RepID=A0ACC2GAZ7_DALPE|nr:hypothetical protein DPEC_G00182620 [Dallia pectoralis]